MFSAVFLINDRRSHSCRDHVRARDHRRSIRCARDHGRGGDDRHSHNRDLLRHHRGGGYVRHEHGRVRFLLTLLHALRQLQQ